MIKKSQPIDIDGIRYKLDLMTGEIDTYSKREVLNSMACSLRRTKIMMNMLLEMNDTLVIPHIPNLPMCDHATF